MDVHIIPILDDNYAYVIQSGDMVGVVDPGESQPIIDYLNENDLTLDWVINTHKHWDHTNGNKKLIEKYGAKLAAPVECDGGADVVLEEGETFPFGDINFDVTLTKGHTAGHVVLYDPTYRILFSGDTLFAMGCGRLFEGTPAEMFKAMQYIKSLPPETAIYCGHEYTKANAEFAKYLLPDNLAIFQRANEIESQSCTMPTTLALELKTNPFLIARDEEQFALYRKSKDNL